MNPSTLSGPAIPLAGQHTVVHPSRVAHARWRPISVLHRGMRTELHLAVPGEAPRNTRPAYVIKELRPEYSATRQSLAMFASEALVGRELSHAHLVPVLDLELARPPFYLVMPRLEGQSLERCISSQSRLAVPLALWYARQVAMALDCLITAGWMHADLHPGNIQIGPDGHATLIDLGCARKMDSELRIWERAVVGTVNYIAPEMIFSSLAADIRSDLYSLGAVLYHALAGQPPLMASNLSELAELHRQAAFVPLRQRAPDVPRDVASLVDRLLAKEPLRRVQTPAELVDALARLEIDSLACR